MNFQTMSKQRKFILICAAVGVISIFLPWVSSSGFMGYGGYNLNGFRGVGIVSFLGFAGALVISLMGDQTKNLDLQMWLFGMAAGAVCVLFTALFLTSDIFVIGNYGFGLWIGLAASVGVLGSAWLFKSPSDNIKDAFDSFKKNISSATSQPSNNSSTGAANTNTSTTSKVAELEKLIELKAQGKITEEEYQQMKAKIM
jgi:hypothetical protein